MNTLNALQHKNPQQINPKKPGPKVSSAITAKSSDELLDTLADIILERITEENQKKDSLDHPKNLELKQYESL